MGKAAPSTLLIGLLIVVWGVNELAHGVKLSVIMITAVGVTLLVASGALWLAARQGGLFRLSWHN